MAIYDAKGVLEAGTAITSTRVSTNSILWDTNSNRSQGVASGNLYLNITCEETFAGNTGALTIALKRYTAAASTSGTVIYQTPSFAIGSDELTIYDGVKGMILCMPLPDDVDKGSTDATDFYLDLLFTVASGPFTTGKLHAWIGPPMMSRYDTQQASSNV